MKNFQPGDEVYGDISESGFGGFAEYVCVRENAVIGKPAKTAFRYIPSVLIILFALNPALQLIQYSTCKNQLVGALVY